MLFSLTPYLSISACFVAVTEWLAVAAGGVSANVHRAVVYCMGYLTSVCARCYF